jgi:amidophosphoribosyltransferase
VNGCSFTPAELRHDKPKEECGVVGVYNHPEAANLAYLSLYAMQHRGQEAAGIVSSDGDFHAERDQGLVPDVFTQARLDRLPGHVALGHNRYSTAGGGGLKNVQPLVAKSSLGTIAMGHNGNLTNADELRLRLEEEGAIFQSELDSEVIMHLIARSREQSVPRRIIDALCQVKGGFSIVFMSPDHLVGVRDPHGFRPLSLGKMGDDTWVMASETCAFDLIGAEFVRDVQPGEMVTIGPDGVTSCNPFPLTPGAFCVFEYIYFSRVDSVLNGHAVWTVRKAQGRQLAIEQPADADIVIPVPDSGVATAMGYAEAAGLPYEMGLIRNHYVGRTFIEPQSSIRHFGVRIKLNPVREVIEGKRVVVVDDSIVRGTTSRKIVEVVRRAGAREVHMRIGSPPIVSPCFYGIDTPTREELIGANKSVEEILQFLTADSLGYLSEAGLLKASPKVGGGYCTACFTEKYPVNVVFDRPRQAGLF